MEEENLFDVRVHQGLIELSQRHQGKDKKPVVKLIYDRGNPKQVFQNRQMVPPEDWAGVGLPSPEDIPNIDFEVIVSPALDMNRNICLLQLL